MLSVERTKELLGEPGLTSEQTEAIRDSVRSLAELIFETWNAEKNGDENESNKLNIHTRDSE